MTTEAIHLPPRATGANRSSPDLTSTGPDGPRRGVFGIKAKLFIAFCTLAALTATAGAVAWYVFGNIDRSVARVTARSVPSMVAALRLAEKSAEIAATAPAIMASASQEERVLGRARLKTRTQELADRTDDLRDSGLEAEKVEALEDITTQITTALEELNAAVEKRLRLKAQREAGLASLSRAHAAFLEVLEPLVDDSVFNLVISGEKVTADSAAAIAGLVEGGVSNILQLLTVNAEGNLAAGLLAEAAQLSDPTRIQPIRERFSAAKAAIDRSLRQLPDSPEKAGLQEAGKALLALGTGADSLFDVRERELRALAEARTSLQSKREQMTADLKAAHERLLAVLTPMVDDATFELVLTTEDVTTQETQAIAGLVEGGVNNILQLLTVNAEGNLAAGLLAEAAQLSDPTRIQPIRERFSAAKAAIDRSLRQLPDGPEKAGLQEAGKALLALGTGANSLFDVRERELRALAEARTSLQSKREQMTAGLKAAHERLLAVLTPMVDDATFELVLTSEDVTTQETRAITDLIDNGVNALQLLLTVRAEGNLAAGLLNQAAGLLDVASLQPLRERFIAAASRIDRMLAQLPKSENEGALRKVAATLVDHGRADDSFFDLRRRELTQIAAAQAALQASRGHAVKLGDAVAELVLAARRDSDAAARRSAEAIEGGKMLLLIITAASVVGAVLVILYYVGPRIVRPLESITAAMTELAAGDTAVDIPGRDRGDELGRMAQALGVFRDTAIEVQESNLREIRETRRQLTDAIESTSEAFSLYDSDDRLVICNSKYRTLLYPGIAEDISPGMKFEAIIRQAVERGYIKDAEGRVEEWVGERLARHRNPGESHVQQRADGRWILVSERKTDDGGTVAVYSDITVLKQREEELAEKSRTLELLSSQLAKYLSPQVYESIFKGRQEVKLASRRKKLTVFFSDVAGFTETADRLESEDLTHLLNHYLTEMSQIALAYGATIDKYVGDAIVIFFGDPGTRGVKEDALACVKMAVAMRERLRELEVVWRASGIEKPLQCRIGINTGYCTVGNFGSEDRMDYTIIGGGVNLASRLESAATPGEILISYETFAQVKEQVLCEERGPINVKGIAYPVATYQVVDTYDNLGKKRQLIHEDHPNLKLELDLYAMTADERSQAETALRGALDSLSGFDERTKTRRPEKTVHGRAKPPGTKGS